MATKPSSGVIAVRSKALLIAAPGTLVFHNLIEPDKDAAERFNSSLKFNAKIAYTEEAAGRLGDLVDEHVIKANWKALVEALDEAKKAAPKAGWLVPSGREWVEEHLKEPGEKARIQLPAIQWANEADFKDRDGKVQRKTMKAYDSKNKVLDWDDVKLGNGSIVQAVLIGGLYVSPLLNKGQPAPSFKLQGVRILKLVQYGAGGGSNLGDLDEADLAMLGEDVEVDDLGSYAAQPKEKEPTRASAPAHADLDDELPF